MKRGQEEPLVSVLMTAYNRQAFIAEAIESVLASDYKNFELIIVDDCSTDDTVEIANEYLNDSRIRLYVNEHNLHQFQNRNKAASYAKGKYIKYVDSDDVIYPHTLTLMVNVMEKFPDSGMAFSDYSGNSKYKFPHFYTPEEILLKHYFGGGILYTGPIGTIIRKDVFENVGGFDLYGMPSDTHFALKVATKYPVVSLYRDLIWWRIHDNQAFKGVNDDVNIIQNYLLNQNILNTPHCPLDEKNRLKAIYNSKKIFLHNLVKLIIKNPKKIFLVKNLLNDYNIKIIQIIRELI